MIDDTTIWSVCPFFNELDVFEVRLWEQESVVDHWVAVEAPWTYRGDEKPLLLTEAVAAGRFDRWKDRLTVGTIGGDWRHVEPPFQRTGEPERWIRENSQRRVIGQWMEGVHPNDVVCISDCDEILKPIAFEAYVKGKLRHTVQPFLPMDLYVPGWRWLNTFGVIARLFRGELLYGGGWTTEMIRQTQPQEQWPVGNWQYAVVPASGYDLAQWGWHLAYMGGPELIRYKVAQAAHPELEPQLLEDLTPCYTHGVDLFGRDWRWCIRVPTDQLPASCARFEWAGQHLLPPLSDELPLARGGNSYVEGLR